MATKSKSFAEYEATLKVLEDISNLDQSRAQNQLVMAERQKMINQLIAEGVGKDTEKGRLLEKLLADQQNMIANEKKVNAELDKQRKNREALVGLGKSLGTTIKETWKYLQEQDKVIKSTILNLGMSGAKATAMRASFEGSAKFAARLGGTLADIQTIQEGFADETGRARAMTSEMLNDITLIGKGTGLGIEQATKLGAQWEFMGLDAKRSMEYVQGIVDTSERMGVNTTKVLKNVSDNFKKLNTYSFSAGVKGMAKMAEDAEKMQVSMESALSAADAAKGLEKAIDLAANLQVMGGEFAKTDPFEWMYLARNEPEKLTQKISEMTRGLVTFKKNSEGVFEKFISPADRDRLASVAKSLGISNEEMIKITQKRAELDLSEKQMGSKGLTAKQKEWIQGAMTLNSKTNQLQVSLGGQMKDISSLTLTQVKSFEQERKLLQSRAEEALTFDETFKATINILKASLIPLLNTINKVMNVTIKPLADMAAKGGFGLAGAGAILLSAGALWKVITVGLNRAAENFVKGKAGRAAERGLGGGIGGFGGGDTGKITGGLPDSGKGSSGLGQKRILEGQGAKMAGKGSMMMKGGAGVGMAAAGAGAGIGAAAAGISLLADAMNKLDPKKAEALQGIVRSISVVVAIGAAAAAAVMIFGNAALLAAPGLGAFSLAVLGIGAGIGIAAAGIGVMGLGLSKMIDSAKGAGTSLGTVALGIAEIGLAMAGTGVASLFGGGAMVIGLKSIANQAPKIKAVGDAFANINAVLSGSKEDFIAVQNAIQAIGNTNIKSSGAFGQLAELLNKPLKVEFLNKNMELRSDITLEIDGNRFMHKVFNEKLAVQMTESARINK